MRRHVSRLRPPAELERDWDELLRPTEPAPPFDPAGLADLPKPAQRWLRHAIEPGTPLRRRVELEQHGQIRLGTWRRFEAVQALAPFEGYVWVARTHLFGLSIVGFDRLTHGSGEMRHRLMGKVPVVSSSGADHTISAAGRLASETIWVPAAGLAPEVSWVPVDDTDVIMRVAYEERTYDVTLTVMSTGALEKVTISRWARVGKGPFRYHVFGAVFHGERNFGGFTVPTRTVAGYGYGSDRWPESAFIRQVIDHATFR